MTTVTIHPTGTVATTPTAPGNRIPAALALAAVLTGAGFAAGWLAKPATPGPAASTAVNATTAAPAGTDVVLADLADRAVHEAVYGVAATYPYAYTVDADRLYTFFDATGQPLACGWDNTVVASPATTREGAYLGCYQVWTQNR